MYLINVIISNNPKRHFIVHSDFRDFPVKNRVTVVYSIGMYKNNAIIFQDINFFWFIQWLLLVGAPRFFVLIIFTL